MAAPFFTPVSVVVTTTFEKKSRFVCLVAPVTTKEQAVSEIEKIVSSEVGANHNCYAFIVGNPDSPQNIHCSDDGEPSGTAGRPLLNILQHENIGNVLVVVTRYFGGVKLGTGGLVRAYSTALKTALHEVELREYAIKRQVKVGFDYPFEGAVRRKFEDFDAEIMGSEYGEKVTLEILISENLFESLVLELRDLTAGCITLQAREKG